MTARTLANFGDSWHEKSRGCSDGGSVGSDSDGLVVVVVW